HAPRLVRDLESLCAHSRVTHALRSFPTRRSSDLWTGKPVKNCRKRRNFDQLKVDRALDTEIQASERFDQTFPSGYRRRRSCFHRDRKSTRLNSSHVKSSYAVFCLKKKKIPQALRL